MKLLHGFDEPTLCRGGFVSIGNFDGVHRGHQSMISALVRHARRVHVPAIVLTFEPPPTALLRPDEAPPRLSTLEWKAELLAGCGVDCTIAYPTDWRLLNLSPEEFFETIVCGALDARGLVEGPNFFFGRDRSGDVAALRGLCEAAGLLLEVVPAVEVAGQVVSSSAVRARVREGRMGEAVEMLGHPYRLRGTVVGGAERGRRLGFPTANLDGIETLLPRDGVYAGIARTDDERWPAAAHVGSNPTYGDQARKVEVHLAGFSGDLYGRALEVDLLDRLRDTVTFRTPEALRAQLERDVEQARLAVSRSES